MPKTCERPNKSVNRTLDSLDEQPMDKNTESAWEAEITLRLQEIDEGKVNLIPWADARAKITEQ